MDALKENITYTTEYIYNLPDGQKAELIDGHIYYMGTPTRIHQEISGILYATIYNYIKSKKGSCKVYSAPFAVFINKDNKNYVEPDISVICDKSKLIDKGCWGSPDWIIEIVSPDSKNMDYYTKFFKYHDMGVREYWIVDPISKIIRVYGFENEMVEIYDFSEKVKSYIYEDLEINFAEINIEV